MDSQLIIGTTYKEPTRYERYTNCFELEMEYSGEGPRIDRENINARVNVYISQQRLDSLSTYIGFFKRINHIENPTYTYAPTRYFRDLKGKEPKKNVLTRIDEIYDELDFNTRLLEFDRKSARVGTLAVTVQEDPDTGQMYFVVMSPDNPSFNVLPSDRIPNVPKQLWYESISYALGGVKTKIRHFWTTTRYVARYVNDLQANDIANENHEFKGVPFAILRSSTDATKFWGPYDNSSLRMSKTRSFMLADAVVRTQTFEMLVLGGFSADEAIQMMQQRMHGKVVHYESEFKNEEQVTKSVDFRSPESIEPEKVLEAFDKIYNFYLSTRDLTPRIYERGKQPASGQAMTQSDKYMRSKREERKAYLARFENQLFNLVRWQNNKNSSKSDVKIPDDLKVEIDWQPDKIEFGNVVQKAKYYELALKEDLLTRPKIIRLENSDLSIEMATEIHQANMKYNAENSAHVEDTDIQDAEKEVAGEKELGNPIEKGSDSKGTFVRWGKSGTKYYYKPSNERSFENAKNKALKQGRAIKANE